MCGKMYTLATAQQALDDLAPLIAALHIEFPGALEDSIVPYFQRENRPFDAVTAAFLFRDQIGYRLKLRNFKLIEDDGDDKVFNVRELALKGIEGTLGNWRFKILRSRNGLVPPPRDSERRAKFYAQGQPAFPGWAALVEDPQERHNIVFLWNYDAEYTEFSLRVAMPLDDTGRVTEFNESAPMPDSQGDYTDLDVRRRTPIESPEDRSSWSNEYSLLEDKL